MLNLKYKIWKKLTKSLIQNNDTRDLVITWAHKSLKKDKIKKKDVVEYKYPENLVTFQGFYSSGSSALVGLFREFDNVYVCGHPEPLYIKGNVTHNVSEMQFFLGSKFFEMVSSFKEHKPITVQDFYIRYFINSVNNAYKHKQTCPYEYVPELYGDYFKTITDELLFSILDLDDYTLKFMQGKDFPAIFESSSDVSFENCSFMHNKGLKQYLFYKFKRLTPTQFDFYIGSYLKKLFSILGNKEFVMYDQLLPNDYLEWVNRYLPSPVKQICIWRDPRDQFISAFRSDMFLMPRDIDNFENFYKNYKMLDFYKGLDWMLASSNPNRLMIRFEDLVLKYDETVKKILDFIGLDQKHHINPKSIFDPKISVKNIGAYHYFYDQEFLKQIEQRLGKYCYYPEKENLSEEAWNLLMSNGNWEEKDA